ncbi:hypothetical protein [Agromyces humatus]|uniref:Uncharacterized protein n=1 Tax=Agromyces humatus TaxID=279573 RepID=A0ABN2KLZ7_9MICO|nr:hypothetical protein [Agromyces humatus]
MTFDNEDAVARALEVASLRDLSKEKRVELAAMLPDIPEPLRFRLYDIVPDFRATELAAVDAYERTYAAGLDADDKNQERLHASLGRTRDIIEGKLARDGLSEEYERYLIESLKEADQLEAEKDTENKAFISNQARETRRGMLLLQLGVPIVTAIVVVGAEAILGRGVPRSTR